MTVRYGFTARMFLATYLRVEKVNSGSSQRTTYLFSRTFTVMWYMFASLTFLAGFGAIFPDSQLVDLLNPLTAPKLLSFVESVILVFALERFVGSKIGLLVLDSNDAELRPEVVRHGVKGGWWSFFGSFLAILAALAWLVWISPR